MDCRFLDGWLCTHSDFRGYICGESYCITEMTLEEREKRKILGFYKQIRDGLVYNEDYSRSFVKQEAL